MNFEYPNVGILSKEEHRDEYNTLLGVVKYDYLDREILFSIPDEFRKIAKEVTEITCFSKEEVYKMWIINAFVHEDLHWLLYEMGCDEDVYDDGVHNIIDRLAPYPERVCENCDKEAKQ